MKILVAEDDVTMRTLLETLLQDMGYETVMAEDGQVALDIVARPDAPRVALIDWIMPKVNGLDFCEQVRGGDLGMYLIMLTSMDDPEDRMRGFEAGVDDYIAKPVDPDELRLRLNVGVRMIRMQQELEDRMAALRASEANYRSIIENIVDVFYRTDADGQLVLVSPSATALLGYESLDQMLQLNVKDLFVDEADRHSMIKELLAKGSVVSWPARIKRVDGSVIHVELSGRLVRDADGNPGGHEGVLRDVTDRKQLEGSLIEEAKALEKVQAELEATNLDLIESYAELKSTQSQFLQREKMASIGQLAAGVAHEINNPIGFITSNLGSLSKYVEKLNSFVQAQGQAIEDGAAEEVRNQIRELKRSLKVDFIVDDIQDLIEESLEGAGRVKRIVQDLKSFSRVDEAEFKHADINECIESTLNIVWNELKYKATVNKDLGDLPAIKCYPQQLNQVFMNLLVNASHAIDEQGVIDIRSWTEDGSIFVTISDNGCGISEENLTKLFEPFFTTKEVGKGTGLGLSITYDIVKKHDGEVTVQSKLGEGTTFKVRLPIKEAR